MKEIFLKNDTSINIRRARPEDAKSIIDYLNKISIETDYLSFGKDELLISIESEVNYITSINNSINSILVVAELNNLIIGVGSLESSIKPRTMHNGVLGISVLKNYWNQGLGSYLMEYIIDFAKSNNITKKINLTVRDDNEKGFILYKKYNFLQEGYLRNHLFIENKYYNLIQMSLEI